MKKEYLAPELELKKLSVIESFLTLSSIEPDTSGEDCIEPF